MGNEESIKYVNKIIGGFLVEVQNYFESKLGISLTPNTKYVETHWHGGVIPSIGVALFKKRGWMRKPIEYLQMTTPLIYKKESGFVVEPGSEMICCVEPHFKNDIEPIFNKWKGHIKKEFGAGKMILLAISSR